MSDPRTGRRRTLLAVLARHAARVRSRRALFRGLGRAVLTTVVAALAAAPFAAAWGIGHAQVEDYLGPHQVHIASNYGGEITIDLGPIGNAYLPSPVAPIGATVSVGGVGTAAQSLGSLFSEQTLAAYTTLYADPEEAIRGISERLAQAALVRSAEVEALLLLGFAVWRLRDRLLAPWVATQVTRRRTAAIYLTVVGVVVGSIMVPQTPQGTRISVSPSVERRLGPIKVDSVLLADLLDRGISGVTLLADRQQQAVAAYVGNATTNLSDQLGRLPSPQSRVGESVLMGFSDLHCNQAMTELISRLERVVQPSVVLSSGDDTVNGTAVERGCIRREAGISSGVPMVVASGNHDSNVTEAQQRSNGMTVLDGGVVRVGGLNVLGDDDPEHNIPFSVDRTPDRPETEEQLGQRLVDVARGRATDVILVHQPAASVVVMSVADPPARLVLWGHFHAQAGPTVVRHADGSWTVGMQEGTAGGVKQPTLTSFSTPFSAPLVSADVYFYFRDDATGLITGVQPVHFLPNADVVVADRIPTGDLSLLPEATRAQLDRTSRTPSPEPSR